LPAPDPRLGVKTHEDWLDAARYLNMQRLRERKREARQRRQARPIR
jgi:hypothetical protein